MNYIKQLQKTVELRDLEIKELREGFQEIRVYLNSPKFSVDTSVNRNDVLLRMEEIVSRANNVESEYDENTYMAEMGFSPEERFEWVKRNEEIV